LNFAVTPHLFSAIKPVNFTAIFAILQFGAKAERYIQPAIAPLSTSCGVE